MTTTPENTTPRRTSSESRYAVKRDVRMHHHDRDQYLRAAKSPRPFNLCQILGRDDHRRTTMPWVTLVLGSGCLENGSGPDGRTLARQVGEALADRHTIDDDESLGSQAQAFTESLIADRLGSLDVPVPILSESERLSRTAPSLVLAACLLTRLFFSAKAARSDAVSRWDDDAVVLDPDDPGPEFDELERYVIAPARKELRVARQLLKEESDGESVAASVSELLRQVSEGINGVGDKLVLSLQQLRLITEIAWYYLVGDKTAYPGWTDLLIRLMLRGDDPSVGGSRRPRPRFLNLKLLGGYVADLLESSSERAWQRRLENRAAAHPKQGIYDAAATVLWAQHEMASAVRVGVPAIPPAVSFVTSFDLELEMSLWARSEGRPFSVALPVHLLRDIEDDEAELCWLLADISPDTAGDWSGGMASLRTPTRWTILRSDFNPRDLRRGPIVVHLNGCPLIDLPDLNACTEPWVRDMREDMADLELNDYADETHLVHAVTVDEYLALRQSEAELFWASEDRANQAQRRSRALPRDLTRDTSRHARFWMVLGVPVADPAIRHRMTSQLTIRRFRDSEAPRPTALGSTSGIRQPDSVVDLSSRSDIDGVAINKRIDDDEASILHWLGLDVVHTGCDAFTADLLHYADHVSRDALNERAPDTGCQLADAEAGR